jgi:hypothetical protein
MAAMILQPWQLNLMEQMSGFKKNELAVISAGRQTGKSVWSSMVKDLTMPDIKVLDSAEVDGKTWYTVQLSIPARTWLKEQPLEDWQEHIDQRYYLNRSFFDVSEQMYSALMLKWK